MKTFKDEQLEKWVEFLSSNRENRGMMASLRRALTENGQAEAWPWLARFCSLTGNPYRLNVFLTLGGLYGYWPEGSDDGKDMGQVCRGLCKDDERANLESGQNISSDLKEGPMSKRFKQLIDSDRDEIVQRVRRIVMQAKAKQMKIDYQTLGYDLLRWGDYTRRKWSESFWCGRSDGVTS